MGEVGRRKRTRPLSHAAAALGALPLVIAITACGGNGHGSTQQTPTGAYSQATVSYSVKRGALVTMRQYLAARTWRRRSGRRRVRVGARRAPGRSSE